MTESSSVLPQSPYQFAVFRWLLGVYLAVHMGHLVPWGPELFSNQGLFADPSVSPLHGLFPNLLTALDAPWAVQFFLGFLCLVAVAFAAGWARPWLAVLLWYGWTCLFNRNILISNPGLPYIGLTLVMCALVPRGEGLAVGGVKAREEWTMPVWLWRGAFVALMAGYTYSGLMKLAAPSWLNGEAVQMLVATPLARDWFVRDILAAMPMALLKAITWVALVGEIVALPLCLSKKGRPIAWTWMLTMHVGIALVVDFADHTLGMILVHLFVFDPRWLPARSPGVRRVVFFDGVCALCDGSMRFLIGEDRERLLKYAPLQGETAARESGIEDVLSAGGDDLQSAIYVRGAGRSAEVFTRSDAILAILDDLGGFWRVIALARFVPRAIRDGVYNVIARYRYGWFGRLETCRLPGDADAGLFLD